MSAKTGYMHSEVYDKKLTFILYNNRSDNERYKCTKKTVVFFIQFQLAYIANHLYTINITFFHTIGRDVH